MVILSINYPENSAKLYIDDNLLALNLVKLHLRIPLKLKVVRKSRLVHVHVAIGLSY